MTLTWIIEKDVFNTKHYETMISHIREAGHNLKIVRVTPFTHEIDGKVPEVDGPVVCYGSIGIANLAKKHGWKPGVFTDEETFKYQNYINSIGNLILNPDATCMYLDEVESHVKFYAIEKFFIKPNDDNKAFAGTVIETKDFSDWVKNLRDIGYLDDNNIEVVVSAVKELAMEWRSIVVDGEVIESSIYRQWQKVMPERNRNPDVDELIKLAHSKFAPAPVYVVDVAQTRDGLKIVEYNTFNSAGFYDCDIPRIVDAVSEYVLRENR